ncbi:Hemolysin-type calcium-binding repeat family protein [Sulfitobacter noctilucae]|uniref:Hint domain-containing protein n=1 Tax=Sulfitobacter noctilucae TaxID=1342302 RepID=UPI00046883B3|nr:Hint domain-containing protein [Sulfitobacter noctilucae]KIN70784.1 Hemolysin-type calcium-binding repeat family protein [Sulfitobacter noctilucae]
MATLNGGDGNDSIVAGDSADTISGAGGNDTVHGNGDSDSISAGDGDDKVYAGSGSDTVDGGSGDDSLDGNSGNDSIRGGTGADTLDGNSGQDTLSGEEGDDEIYGGGDDDSISGGAGNDWLVGQAGNDSISGGAGFDNLQGGEGDDALQGGSEADNLDGGAGNDSALGGTGNDTLLGQQGDDTLHGGDGADSLQGHEGADALYGDAGDDSLYGGSGGDYFDGGSGSDSYYMDRNAGGGPTDPTESDRDVVRFEPGLGHDFAFDFEGEDDFIYIGSTPPSSVEFFQIDEDTWQLTFAGNNDDSLTLDFAPGTAPDSEGDLRNQLVTSGEYTPAQNGNPAIWSMTCFTPHARILTPCGYRPLGALQQGDLVITADRGTQPVLALLSTRLSANLIRSKKNLRPVVIEKGAFGDGLPFARMHVSRQHAFALQDGRSLIRAIHLTDRKKVARVQNNRPNAIRYIHILLARHELVNVEGVWTESYYCKTSAPGIIPLDGISNLTPLHQHKRRCRPLLSRAELRETSFCHTELGRLADQSVPKTFPAVRTAFAPAGASP